MDDNGIEEEFSDDSIIRLTPKGFYMSQLQELGATRESAKDLWHRFESFCVKIAGADCPEASHAAVVFDGAGGEVVGLDLVEKIDS